MAQFGKTGVPTKMLIRRAGNQVCSPKIRDGKTSPRCPKIPHKSSEDRNNNTKAAEKYNTGD